MSYESPDNNPYHHHRVGPKYIHLGREFKSYMKRYKSPGAPAADATMRKKERQALAARKGPSPETFVPHTSGKTSRRNRIKLHRELGG
jgi:hypothetical protein